MQGTFQQQIAFYLTGRRDGWALLPMDATFRPALFAGYGDLSALRYDLPLVLDREGPPERAVLSLSGLVDEAVESMGEDPVRDRVARHGYRIEAEVRRDIASIGSADFATLWNAAAARLAGAGDEFIEGSARRLWTAFDAAGELVDADADLPSRAICHAWSAVQVNKGIHFRLRAERLLQKLRDILEAERVGSAAGRAPDRLMAGVGASFAGTFDFDAMSRILVDAKPSFELSEQRRDRINSLIEVLEHQQFYPLGTERPEQYNFAFVRCSDALKAYQERHAEAVDLVRTLAFAELEASGEYRESIHDVLFEGFGANGLDAAELAQLPDYLVCTDGKILDPVEASQLIELLAAGLPIKVLVQTDDVLEPSVVAEGHVALGLRARQLVDTAIGLTDVFVFQTSASNIYKKRESMFRGLTFDGPALFSVFSGANECTGDIPAYLVAAAATESRAFPSLVYDPSAGADWASRMMVDDNPSPDDDWPIHQFAFEDETLQARSEMLSFTLADFIAMDRRFHRHFAIAEQCDQMISVSEALHVDMSGVPEQVPTITLLDSDGAIQRAIIDDRTLFETRRCLSMWHSLQELGGIHNSHAERLVAKELKAQAAASVPVAKVGEDSVDAEAVQPSSIVVEVPVVESAAEESHGDDPYIESTRCTTCNECTILNNRMFAYNDEKQAYIADPDAGTFRQLVEAAEGCQVSIIHPGKPRNLKEPGLEDLLERAAAFN